MKFAKKRRKTCTVINITLFMILILFSTSFCDAQVISAKEVNWPVFMSKQSLKWNNLGDNYYSGVILGNGLLGINIYKENDSLIRFDIGRSDVTDHRENFSSGVSNLYSKARLPIGYFTLKTVGKIISAKMELDIYNAEVKAVITTTKGDISILALVLANGNVISVSANSMQQESVLAWKWNPERSISPRYLQAYPKDKPLDYAENPPIKITNENGYIVCNQPLLNKGGYSTVYKVNGNSRYSKLLVSVGYDPYNKLNETKEALNNLENFKNNRESILAHRNWWHNYYQQSFIALPDKRMENFYWIQLYKLASATRADKPMVDLMGPWTTATPWPGIWWNLNTQLAYSPIFTSNHLELGESLFKSLNDNKQNLINNVPEKWRSDAIAIGRSSAFDLVSPITEEEIEKGTF